MATAFILSKLNICSFRIMHFKCPQFPSLSPSNAYDLDMNRFHMVRSVSLKLKGFAFNSIQLFITPCSIYRYWILRFPKAFVAKWIGKMCECSSPFKKKKPIADSQFERRSFGRPVQTSSKQYFWPSLNIRGPTPQMKLIFHETDHSLLPPPPTKRVSFYFSAFTDASLHAAW